MVKHTQGPWTILADEIWTQDETFMVATVTGGEGAQFEEDDQNAECVANARLIAAAPELLAALRKIDSNAESVEWIRRVARAAIAKAEGEANAF